MTTLNIPKIVIQKIALAEINGSKTIDPIKIAKHKLHSIISSCVAGTDLIITMQYWFSPLNSWTD
jgi:hypothetical protein